MKRVKIHYFSLWCAQYLIPANHNSPQNLLFSQLKRFTLSKFTLWWFFLTVNSFFSFHPWIVSKLLTFSLKCRHENWKQYSRLSFSNAVKRCKITLFDAFVTDHLIITEENSTQIQRWKASLLPRSKWNVHLRTLVSTPVFLLSEAVGKRLPWGFDCHVHLLPYRE